MGCGNGFVHRRLASAKKGERHQIDEPGPPGVDPHVILQLRRMRLFPRLRRDDQSYHNAGHQAQKDISDDRCKLKSLRFHSSPLFLNCYALESFLNTQAPTYRHERARLRARAGEIRQGFKIPEDLTLSCDCTKSAVEFLGIMTEDGKLKSPPAGDFLEVFRLSGLVAFRDLLPDQRLFLRGEPRPMSFQAPPPSVGIRRPRLPAKQDRFENEPFALCAVISLA